MTRLPFRTRDALDDDAREVWDAITATRASIVTEVAPLVIEVPTSWKANIPRVRWAKKAGSLWRRMIVTRT